MTSMPVVASFKHGPGTREVGQLAVWSVTSAKPGNGVDMLRDGREDTYWQSDGMQPHLVDISFQKKTRVSTLAVLLNYKLDESYTPRQLAVRGGTSYTDLKEIRTVEVNEPQGWVVIPLGSEEDPSLGVKLFLLQLMIVSNHQNGKDTHVREVRVYGPQQATHAALSDRKNDGELELSASLAAQFDTVR
ncbi:APC10 [Auxenochlorella protothecoides x Auxenochlorella symbiontica]